MSSNPFIEVEAWEVSSGGGGLLKPGEHKCMVLEADGSKTSTGGYPQIVLKVGNDDGEITDWVTITPNTIGKVNQILRALGDEVAPPAEGDFDPSDFRLSQKYLDTWLAKNIGVVVHQEPDYKDPSVMRDRVKGFIPTADVKAGAVPAAAAPKAHDDVPF